MKTIVLVKVRNVEEAHLPHRDHLNHSPARPTGTATCPKDSWELL
jgi:hypothetical protein